MPKPTTLNATVALIRESQLVPEDRLSHFLAGVKPQRLREFTPTRLLDELVAADLLTNFQAEQISHGRSQGFVLGNYRILSLIGKGGMGQIYLAEHEVIGSRAAIKVLRPKIKDDPLAAERFLREATAAAMLTNPNIVRIFDVYPESNPPYMVMEYIDGVSLQASIAQLGPFSVAEACYCGTQIAMGLQAIHEAGLVHRDIKPANVLVNRSGVAKILDLGIVHMKNSELTDMADTELVLGTLDYIAPEQIFTSHVDIRADLYSLGATLFFLLTGQPPFPCGDLRTKILHAQTQTPPDITSIRPDVPPHVANVVRRLLAKNPQDRLQTPLQVVAALGGSRTPLGFPSRLFNRTSATESESESQTDVVQRCQIQPPLTPPPRHRREDASQGTVEFAKDPTVLPNSVCEMTMRTQLDVAMEEAILRESSYPSEEAQCPQTRQERMLRGLSWGIVAGVVLILGFGTLVKLLTTP